MLMPIFPNFRQLAERRLRSFDFLVVGPLNNSETKHKRVQVMRVRQSSQIWQESKSLFSERYEVQLILLSAL